MKKLMLHTTKFKAIWKYLWVVGLHLPLAVKAASPLDSLRIVGDNAYGNPQTDLKLIIANLVRVVLGFVGIVFLILIIVGGVQWMTSGGNEQKIESAKKRITNATVGLVIIVISYSIAYSITKWLAEATKAGGTNKDSGSGTN